MLSRIALHHRQFATKMMATSTSNKKDSAGRRLGLKKFGPEEVRPHEILIRQRGKKWHPGDNVYITKDHSIHAKLEGKLFWTQDRYAYKRRKRLHLIP